MWACIGTKEYDFGATHRGKTIIFQGGDDPAVCGTGGTVSLALEYQCRTDMDKLEEIQTKVSLEGKGLERIFYTRKISHVFYMAWWWFELERITFYKTLKAVSSKEGKIHLG